MRIAIFSDIHGNFHALRAVLDNIKEKIVDDIYFLGDLCTLGPNPNESAELLFDSKVKSILGNHDEYLFNEPAIYSYTNESIIIDSILWCRDTLNNQIINLIKEFPDTINFNISKNNSILFYHGSPKSNTDNILADTNILILNKYFSEYSNNIFIGGHTHIQMQNRYFHKTIINPGSVGQPFQANIEKGPPSLLPFAEYLILNLKNDNIIYEYHQIKYDINEYVKQIKTSKLPLKNWLLGQYKI